MLAVDVNQKLCQLFYLSGSYRFTVDSVNAFPHLHPAADDYCSVFLRFQFQLKQLSAHSVVPADKDQLHQGVFLALPQHLFLEFPSQRQIDASDQQGFSRSCLPCKDIQPSAEFYLCLLHQSQIFHM